MAAFRPTASPVKRARPRLERLEDRTVPSITYLGSDQGGVFSSPLTPRAAAMDAVGDAVVVGDAINGTAGITAQRFDRTGAPQGSAISLLSVGAFEQVPGVG